MFRFQHRPIVGAERNLALALSVYLSCCICCPWRKKFHMHDFIYCPETCWSGILTWNLEMWYLGAMLVQRFNVKADHVSAIVLKRKEAGDSGTQKGLKFAFLRRSMMVKWAEIFPGDSPHPHPISGVGGVPLLLVPSFRNECRARMWAALLGRPRLGTGARSSESLHSYAMKLSLRQVKGSGVVDVRAGRSCNRCVAYVVKWKSCTWKFLTPRTG